MYRIHTAFLLSLVWSGMALAEPEDFRTGPVISDYGPVATVDAAGLAARRHSRSLLMSWRPLRQGGSMPASKARHVF